MKGHSPLRKAFLLLVPAITAVLLARHPPETDSAFDLRGDTDRWLVVHVGLLVMIPLIAIVVWMLLDGIGNGTATVSRVMLVAFVGFYAAFESMVGIGTGVLIVETDALSPATQEGAEALTESWWDVPMPIPIIAAAAILSWIVSLGAATVAHVRVRSPLPVVLGLGAATILFALGHPGITGALAMAGLFVSTAVSVFGLGGDRGAARPETG